MRMTSWGTQRIVVSFEYECTIKIMQKLWNWIIHPIHANTSGVFCLNRHRHFLDWVLSTIRCVKNYPCYGYSLIILVKGYEWSKGVPATAINIIGYQIAVNWHWYSSLIFTSLAAVLTTNQKPYQKLECCHNCQPSASSSLTFSCLVPNLGMRSGSILFFIWVFF